MEFRHVLSTTQFQNKDLLHQLFLLADEMERNNKDGRLFQSLQGKVMAALFYEPSTRTRFSFESAMNRLGGRVITTESATQFSSVTKGETLEDTIRILGSYADVIVLRHFEVGSAGRAAKISSCPVINAGDGPGEHPTQALLDLYTIYREKGRIDGLNIALIGDLLYGRTIHSLLDLLSIFDNIHIHLVSPKELALPERYKEMLLEKNVSFSEHKEMDGVLSKTDVLYVTRVQKERFASLEEYERVKDCCVVNETVLEKLPHDAIVMHPLPRVNEIAPGVDADPRAAYFRQAANGLFVRMALLELLFGRKSLHQKSLTTATST
jgi:aspartate carbamoyltransferase catalytic subunit